jgi:hypothetical protein
MNAYAVAFLLVVGTIPDATEKLEESFSKLKEAQAGTDTALVQKLAGDIWTITHELVAESAPEVEADKDAWTKRIAWAREIQTYAEYAVGAAAMKAANPADTITLISMLEKQNPSSKYLDEAYGNYFVALNRTGAAAKIPAAAENALRHFPNNEDALLVLADRSMSRNETDRALNYAERLLAVAAKHPKPEGMPAADWERKRSSADTRAHWIAGVMHSQKAQYYEADKDLRAALPFVKDNQAMLAATLFHLGVANYQLAAQVRERPRMMEAARFSEEAAKIKGPLSEQAWRNAQIMKAEAQKVR